MRLKLAARTFRCLRFHACCLGWESLHLALPKTIATTPNSLTPASMALEYAHANTRGIGWQKKLSSELLPACLYAPHKTRAWGPQPGKANESPKRLWDFVWWTLIGL